MMENELMTFFETEKLSRCQNSKIARVIQCERGIINKSVEIPLKKLTCKYNGNFSSCTEFSTVFGQFVTKNYFLVARKGKFSSDFLMGIHMISI